MKTIFRSVPIFLATCLITAQASALIKVCFPYTHNCYTFEGSCENWHGGGICFTLGPLMFNPHVDFIDSTKNPVCIVQRDEKILISSAERNNVLARIEHNYKDQDLQDPKIRQQIEAEYSAVLKGVDHGIVTDKQLKRMSKATGLRIRK